MLLLVQSKHQILLHGHMRKQSVRLKDNAEVSFGRRQLGTVLSINKYLSHIGSLQPCNDPQKGGLSAA